MGSIVRTQGLIKASKTITPADSGTAAMFGGEHANVIYQEATGDVSVLMADGTTQVWPGLMGGTPINIGPFSRVNDTGTDATSVVVAVTYE